MNICVDAAEVTVVICVDAAEVTVVICVDAAEVTVVICVDAAEVTVVNGLKLERFEVNKSSTYVLSV